MARYVRFKTINPRTNKPYRGSPPRKNNHSNVQILPKNHRVLVALTKHDRENLAQTWQNRTYPDPHKPERDVKFRSQSQYLEFLIKAANEAGPTHWYILKHMLNPNVPK